MPSAPDLDLLRAVLDYTEKQGLPLFPCRPDKIPLVKGGYKSASDDPAQLREWFGVKYPHALIGMPTGAVTDIHVTDVDVKSRDGFATVKRLGLQLDHLPQVQTPSGGSHFYNRLGGLNLRCTAGKLGPGVDTRANGGYVILPPSRPDPKRAPYAFVNGANFLLAPVVPPELVKLLREGVKPKPKEELEEECARVASAAPGQRNDTLNKAAFRIAKLVAAGKLKESEVREALTKAALACALEPYEIEKTLDSALSAGKRDAEASGGRKAREKAQGRALELPDAVPWEEAVDGAALAHALVADVKRFVVVTDPQADGLALWVLHTHALSGTGITPRLAITSPVAGCGKTTLLEWLGSVARRPLESVNISPSATFRTIEAVQPTLLVDEADTLLKENEELRSVLNSGHRVGGSVIRTSGEDFEPRCFSTWSACAIALIGKLPPTLESRSIEIALRRKMRSEVVLRWRSGRAEATVLARQARRWAIDNVESLKGADPDLPERLFNRSADNWRPLIAIADRLGADWPGRARIAAEELSGFSQSGSLGIELLADIREAFTRREVDRFASDSLIAELIVDPEKAWAEFGRSRKPITQRQLARLLKPFGIEPKSIRMPEQSTKKGYLLEWFEDVFSRYLPL